MNDINPQVLARFQRAFSNLQPRVVLEGNQLRINSRSSGNNRKSYVIPLTPRTIRGFGYSK